MDAIVTLDNFKLMVCALIKFLNQLSERDKAAAIKFLIATLKNSTKEQFKYWSDEDRSVWFDSTRIFDRKTSTSTTKATTAEAAALTAKSGKIEQYNAVAAANDEDDDSDVACIALKWPTDTGLSFSLENIKSEGNFCTALVPFRQEQKPYQQRAHLRGRFRVGTPFGRDIRTLYDDLGDCSRERDLLKIFLNRLIFDQADNDRSLVRVHQHIDHLRPEAKLTEIKDEDVDDIGDDDDDDDDDIDRIMETDETTQKSSEESLPETGDKNDGDASPNSKAATTRKRKLYKCFQCPKFYLKRKTLAVHYKFHPGFCYDCGQPNGSTIEERVQHNRLNHSKQYPYVCDKCGDSMSRNQQYLSHMKTHDKEPTFRSECLRCGEKFTNAKAYKDHLHEMGHMEGARVCEYCGKSFADGAMLQQHIKRVHQSSKAHPCEHCNKSFDNRSNLLRHMHLHKNQGSNFVCSQCSATYTTMNALKDHINDKHTKKKVHTCETCNKEFTNGHLYRNHVVTHSEDRPFDCTICSKAFKLKTNLVRHTKRCHAGEEKKDGSGSASGMKRPSSEKDESSADMSPTPPLKKPFQPFSSESSFFKNNIPSVHFQSSSSTQSPSSISNEADLLMSKDPNPVIEAKMQQFQHQAPTVVPSMQETFPRDARDATFAGGPVAFPPAVNIPPTQLPPNANQGYMPYGEPFQQQHLEQRAPPQNMWPTEQTKHLGIVPGQQQQQQLQSPPLHQPKANPKGRGAAKRAPPQQAQPPPQPQQHVPQQQQQQHFQQHNRQQMESTPVQQHQYTNMRRFIDGPSQHSGGSQLQQQQQQQHQLQQQQQLQQHQKQQQQPKRLHSSQHPQHSFSSDRVADSIAFQQQQQQLQHHPHERYMQQQQQAAYLQQQQPQQYQQYQHQQHQQPQPQPHLSNQVYAGRAPAQSSKSRGPKYDYNYQQPNNQPLQPQIQHSQAQVSLPIAKHEQTSVGGGGPYAYASNQTAGSAYNVEANAWNQMTPTLVETSSGQYMPIDQIEMSKYNRSMPAADPKMQSFPYQNMWPTEQTKIDFETNNLDAVPKQEQQPSAPGAAANTYNNIGSILTNLELLGNNSNFDPGNYEVMSSNYAQMPAANGDTASYYNIQSSHGQQYQHQQKQQNLQNSFSTDRVTDRVTHQTHQHPQDNNSWTADNRGLDDFKSADNFMELNNASGNVLLPSLADYLYQPLGGTGADVPVPNNNNI